MGALRIPVSTYRLQFSLSFRYVDGRDLVPYLNALGITDLYSSPRFKARRGSPHAYDVENPLRINSELGTEEEFEELAAKLKNYGMGLVLDIVPNHMATSSGNPWWMDVLENGKDSLYAHHFAVDWGRKSLKSSARDRIVLPILGDLYGAVLDKRQLSVKLDENGFFVTYYDHRLPLDPKTYPLILEHCGIHTPELDALVNEIEALPAGDPAKAPERHGRKQEIKRELWRLYNEDAFKAALDDCLIEIAGTEGNSKSVDLLDRILDRQSYRLAYWRTASEELNYRRFFDINDLIGVRVEEPDVFDSRHMEISGLVKTGRVTGLRVDHIDGLRKPAAYLRRLRTTAADDSTFYVIVEKILGSDEELPQDWETFGTTGYDFVNFVNGLFVSPEGIKALGDTYRRFTGFEEDFARVRYTRKKQIMNDLFAGEVRSLGFHLGRLAAQDRYARDLPYESLIQALTEVTACFPIYRTYVHDCRVSPRDRRFLEQALDTAEHTSGESGTEAFAFLRRVLLLDIPHYIHDRRHEWLEFVMSWQQFTGPVMAKGFEDTACYVYNRLISQNEVGSDPVLADLPPGPDEFHRRNLARLARQPHTMNATSSHDTKRSEDVRARINVLSEIPRLWARHVTRWGEWNSSKKKHVGGKPAPDANDEYMFYQTMAGVWPLASDELPALPDRLKNYAQKAVREAKVHTNWLSPNEAYESALLSFIDAILAPGEDNVFLKDFLVFHRRIASAGAVNSLAQTLLKIASPGVPDFYQGTELWDFSLVDPDNRRPVDFTRRSALLDEIRRSEAQDLPGLVRDLCAHWQDGRIKLYLTYKALNFRRAHTELFQHGEYMGLSGDEHACGFARRLDEHWVIAAVPRLIACLAPAKKRLLHPNLWGNAAFELPEGAPSRWRNVFTGEEVTASGKELRLADAFASFPAALLTGE